MNGTASADLSHKGTDESKDIKDFAKAVSAKAPGMSFDKRQFYKNTFSRSMMLDEEHTPGTEEEALATRFRKRKILMKVCNSLCYRMSLQIIIIANMVIGIIETDKRAAQKDTPHWITVCSYTMLAVYILDAILRLSALGRAFFEELFNVFDLFVVVMDTLITIGLAVTQENRQTSIVIAVLRGLRMLRTFRVLRNFLMFHELYVMLQGFAGAIRTLLFGLALVFVVLTSWSCLAVEVLHPLNGALVEAGFYVDCERCQRAFESVMTSNLTFIKHILAGDSWSEVSVPLMEYSPTATVLLIAVFVTLQWGLMNVITAVIVDSQAASREKDAMLTAVLKQVDLQESYTKLLNLFIKMDRDESGFLTLPELQRNYKTNSEFREVLNLMDISSENLDMFFEILDADQSGGIGYHEFVKQLHSIKTFDSHTLLIFIRHLVTENSKQMSKYFDRLDTTMSQMMERLPGQHRIYQSTGDAFELRLPTPNARGCSVELLPVPPMPQVGDDSILLIASSSDEKLNKEQQMLSSIDGRTLTEDKGVQNLQALIAQWHARLQKDVVDIAAYASERVAVPGEHERSQQDLFEIAAYASKKIAASGDWLQSASSLREAGTQRDGIALSKTPTCENECTTLIGKVGVNEYNIELDWQQDNGSAHCHSASEMHLRPHARRPNPVSTPFALKKRHAPRRPNTEPRGDL